MSSKFTLLNEAGIRAAVSDGLLKSETVDVIRDQKNSFVRHLKRKDTPTIPSSIVQVVNNVIYEADTTKFVDAVIDVRRQHIVDELRIRYDEVIVGLATYKKFGTDLEDLNLEARKSLSSFGARSSQILCPKTATPFLEDSSIEILDSYVNLIFVYVMSGFWRFRSQFSEDPVATPKLDRLEAEVKNLYSWLLQNEQRSNHLVGDSVYAHVLLDKPSEIEIINQLVEYDDRYDSGMDFIRAYSIQCIQRATVGWKEPYKVDRIKTDSRADER
ncbi:MAG: hypothetical protein H5U29_13675, partial [Pusillimonas sp.]|nr:hypothetical protein [Pusillimonas sp.]